MENVWRPIDTVPLDTWVFTYKAPAENDSLGGNWPCVAINMFHYAELEQGWVKVNETTKKLKTYKGPVIYEPWKGKIPAPSVATHWRPMFDDFPEG